jgi:predicted O-methyltransferase YrrM
MENLAEELDLRVTIPAECRDTSITPGQGQYIYSFLKKNALERTLEIGFAYGYSTACIMRATGSPHVVIDPYQEEYGNLGIFNIGALGFADRLTHYQEVSHAALPRMLAEGKTFQFVFVDGGHKFDDIFIDWYYSDLLLEPGGYIIFHDAHMRSTQVVAEFIRKNRSDYREHLTPVDNLFLFQKTGTDTRPWYHFNEF